MAAWFQSLRRAAACRRATAGDKHRPYRCNVRLAAENKVSRGQPAEASRQSLFLQQPGKRSLVHFTFDGMQVMQDSHAVVGIGG